MKLSSAGKFKESAAVVAITAINPSRYSKGEYVNFGENKIIKTPIIIKVMLPT